MKKEVRLCPVCRGRYFYTWVDHNGSLFYVHRYAKTTDGNQYQVTGCILDEGSLIRGVSFSSKARRRKSPRGS